MRPAFLALVLGLAFLASASARAQTSEEQLQTAIAKSDEGEFEESIAILKEVVTRATDPQVLSQANLYLGLNYGTLDQIEKAQAAFTTALGHNPLLRLDPEVVKPSLVAIFVEIKGTLTGTVEVIADHEGAKLTVDDEAPQELPATLTLPIGVHHLTIATPDGKWRYEEKELLVYPNRRQKVEAKLLAQVGMLSVSSAPAGATILIDGKEVGITPLENIEVAPGQHQVATRLKDHHEETRTLEFEIGKPQLLSLILKPLAPEMPEIERPSALGRPSTPRRRARVPKRPKEPTVTEALPPRRPFWRRHLYSEISAGVAVLSLTAGIINGMNALRAEEEANTCGREDRGLEACTLEGARRRKYDAENFARNANIFYGLSAAATGTAAFLFFYLEDDGGPATGATASSTTPGADHGRSNEGDGGLKAVAPMIGPGLAGIALEGRF